jgi:hypothetical protein
VTNSTKLNKFLNSPSVNICVLQAARGYGWIKRVELKEGKVEMEMARAEESEETGGGKDD